MDKANYSVLTDFILLGFTDNPQMQLPLFVMFLLVYVVTIIWNLGMIVLIYSESQLQNPMYFFLGNLSFVDLCYSSVIAPKMLSDFLSKSKRISYNACAIQMYIFGFLADVECLLLAVMAYDRYVAICNPLLYTIVMSKRVCKQLIAAAYIVGMVDSMIHTCNTFRLQFCRSNVLNHFFCDIPPLLALSCSDTYINEIVMFTFIGFIIGSSIGMILVSYTYILSTIMKMRSAEGRKKAFSTCASHLTAVGIFHGTMLFMYFRPSSSYSLDQDKWVSMFYTVVIPMLNPLIYSLRNNDVKQGVKESWSSPHQEFCEGRRIQNYKTLGLILSEFMNQMDDQNMSEYVRTAFDAVPRSQLWLKLAKTLIDKRLLWLISKHYENPTAQIDCGLEGQLTNTIPLLKGFKQGYLLAPMLFNLYINDTIANIKEIAHHAPVLAGQENPILLYADDIVLLSRSEVGLRKILKSFIGYWTQGAINKL
ncbi:olfactory receptor 5AR1-like [Heteronotia binoei]|uniref:olfactory receptor 5AR1-like n=1 Tax=Heteronotia binoei TaxID=13085 RepID=UPI002930E0B6|nr:olfactory receptor 5AR1-like [Heteronotia binoei]